MKKIKHIKKIKKNKSLINKFRGSSSTGILFVLVIMLVTVGAGYTLVGGHLTSSYQPNPTSLGERIIIDTPAISGFQKNLQLYTFFGKAPSPTVASTPIPTTIPLHGCQGAQFNTESQILVGSDPPPGGTAVAGGTIRVWVNDEGAPYVAPDEVADTSTGQITTIGDTTATDVNTDGNGNFLWEPTIYNITTQTLNANGAYCDAHTAGCTPIFPNAIKGDYGNTPASQRGYHIHPTPVSGANIDPFLTFENGPDYLGLPPTTDLPEQYTAEFIWNVSSLGLTAGNHMAQFVIHDGDSNLAIDCINISI